jgi:CDP-L-myo-inositol myo-inositolphosphotransferase
MTTIPEENVVPARQAVIIAAGRGSRLQGSPHPVPKPLLEIFGVPLLSRTIMTARKAGIDRFLVVTGHRGGELEDFLGSGALQGVDIKHVRNDEWQRANGLSVLKARGEVDEPFLLLMADHLFEEEIIRKVLSDPLPPGHCRLAVDSDADASLDLEDATKVKVAEGQISDIGKELQEYNAIDTGIFLCSGSIFEALESALSKGGESLSEGIRELAGSRRMEACEVSGLFWQDVDTRRDLKAGEDRILRTLVSGTDSWLTRMFNRRVSLALTRRLSRTRITPNQITLFNLFLGTAGALSMLSGTYAGFVAGAVLFLTSSILDGCDGEIARLKFQESRGGAWLDVIADNFTHLALFTCLTIGLIRYSGSLLYLLPGGLLLAGSVASFFMSVLARRKLGGGRGLIFSSARLQDVSTPGTQKKLASWLDRLANRDFAYLLLLLAVIGRTGWFLWIAGIGALVFGIFFYRALSMEGV